MAQPRVDGDDRLSSLPDGVISHILSFLPTTEESVRTRVLSTRWNHLFSLVPTLNFYYTSSSYSSPPRTTYTQPKKRIKRFLNFVDWVFASYNAGHMLQFSFTSLQFLPKTSPLLSWISQSVRHGVQELIIDVWLPKPLKFPQCIFTCHTITWLKLYGATNNNIILDVPQDVCLPRVKRIELVYVSFLDSDSARRLFRTCPVLEWLCLNSAYTGDIYTLDISVPTLKDFTLFSGDEGDFNLVLDVPNLKHFCYYGLAGIGQDSFSIRGLKLLSVANIIFLTHSSEGYKALEHLLNVICQVKKLHLWHYTLESFQRSGRSFPLFCNLTTLEIEDISLVDPEVLLNLLDRTPHLETLKVNNGGFSESGHHIHFPGERVPTCVSLHLKEVTFDCFGMLETEFKMVEYLLKNGKILKTFKISYCGSQEKEVEIRKKLLAFSRWSRDCQIELKQDMGHRLGIFRY